MTFTTLARLLPDQVATDDELRAAFDHALDAMLLAGDDRRYVAANAAAGELLAADPADLIGLAVDDVAADPAGVPEAWDAFRAEGRQQGRFTLRRRDGEIRQVDFAAVADVRPGRHLTVMRDVTRQVAAEAERAEATQRFTAAFEHAPIGMALVSFEPERLGRVLQANRAMREALGYGEEELTSLAPERLSHPDDLHIGVAETMALLAGERDSCSVEKRFLRKDGTAIHGRLQVSMVRDAPGGRYAVVQFEDVTERLAAAAAVAESEARFRRLAESAQDAIFLYRLHPEPAFEYVSPAVERIVGYTPEDHYAEPGFTRRVVHPEDRHLLEVRPDAMDAAAEIRWIHRDGQVVWTEQRLTPVRDADGRVVAVQGVVRDITDRRQAEEERRRLAAIVEAAPDAIVSLTPDGTVTSWNPGAEALYGYSAQEMLGRSASRLLLPGTPDGTAGLVALLEQGRPIPAREVRRLRKDGTPVDVAVSVGALRDAAGRVTGLFGVSRDVSDRKRLERRLRHQAEHDELTGLYNRRRFERAIEEQIGVAQRDGRPAAVVKVDVDHFTFVNDSFGHGVGDDVLRGVAQVLRDRTRRADAVARLGGDEFALLLTDAGGEAAAAVARDVLARIRALDLPARVTASAGLAVVTGDASIDADDVLINADMALYQAKETGRDRVEVFAGRPGDTFTWLLRIREAVRQDRLVLHGQPILDLASGAIAQQELLVRMVDDAGAIIPPSRFLPTAERFDLIRDIDRWVVDKALALAPALGRLEVNLSARSIGDRELLRWLERRFAETGVAPADIVFEITETAAFSNLDEVRRFVGRLVELGCGVALDDFGTGFGSLTYLKHLPVSHIKIDMDFVRGLAGSEADQRIVQAIVSIAQGHGIATIAEGVEDAESLALLREYGVDFAQGYHIAKPAPVALP